MNFFTSIFVPGLAIVFDLIEYPTLCMISFTRRRRKLMSGRSDQFSVKIMLHAVNGISIIVTNRIKVFDHDVAITCSTYALVLVLAVFPSK